MNTTRTQTAAPIDAHRKASQGDARALLSIPSARGDVARLIRGERAARNSGRGWRHCTGRYASYNLPLATDFGRKVVAVAKTILSARQGRREALEIAEKARSGEPGRTLRLARERAAVRRTARLNEITVPVQAAFNRLYRTYADNISLEFGDPAVRVHTTTKWVAGRSGFGHVTDGQNTRLIVPETWLDEVGGRNLDCLDGLLTLSAELVDTADGIEVYRAAWVVQGRGYELKCQSGHIARHAESGTTYHSPHPDIMRARKALRRKLTAQGVPQEVRDARKAERAKLAASRTAHQIAKLVEMVAQWDFEAIRHVEVGYRDSIKAGNCHDGTVAFARRLFPGRDPHGSATVGEIAEALGRRGIAELATADVTMARQFAAAVLQSIRRDRNARRTLATI